MEQPTRIDDLATVASDRVRVKFSQNSKGINWEFTVEGTDGPSVQEKVIAMRKWCEAQINNEEETK